jgi:phytoene synthase
MNNQNLSDKITRQSKTNFGLSFAMLPKDKRDAMRTLYAFCRQTDDIVDKGGSVDERQKSLDAWSRSLRASLDGNGNDPLLNQFALAAHSFGIPSRYMFELIEGMRMDLEQDRYGTFEELEKYCYHVAATVGLMSGHIFGFTDPSTPAYARKLGIALQLINIIRDVGSDAKIGRIYLPQEDLDRFSYGGQDVMNRVYDVRFTELMKFEAARARRYYNEAAAMLPACDFKSFIAARIMGGVYISLLDRIERSNFDVYGSRIRVSKAYKLRIAVYEKFRRTP